MASTKYAVNWDNGNEAIGTFPYRFNSNEEAQEWADNWAAEQNLEVLGKWPRDVEACGGEGCYTAEVIEVDEPDVDEEVIQFDGQEFWK